MNTYMLTVSQTYRVSAPSLVDARACVDAVYDRATGGKGYVHFDDDTAAELTCSQVLGTLTVTPGVSEPEREQTLDQCHCGRSMDGSDHCPWCGCEAFERYCDGVYPLSLPTRAWCAGEDPRDDF